MVSNRFITGIDEVGRGSLFGPIYACVVLLNKESSNYLKNMGIRDSKKLSKKKRDYFYELIKLNSFGIEIGQASPREIDHYGIRISTEFAMIRALNKLKIIPKKILIDGNLLISKWYKPQKAIIRGDDKVPAISAASIVAKVERDKFITKLSKTFQNYHLESNAGYGTRSHIEAIKSYGLSRLHRKSFCKNFI